MQAIRQIGTSNLPTIHEGSFNGDQKAMFSDCLPLPPVVYNTDYFVKTIAGFIHFVSVSVCHSLLYLVYIERPFVSVLSSFPLLPLQSTWQDLGNKKDMLKRLERIKRRPQSTVKSWYYSYELPTHVNNRPNYFQLNKFKNNRFTWNGFTIWYRF